MSYCVVADVLSAFPRFVPDQSGSVANPNIQLWIDDAAGQIHASFYARGLDVDNLVHPLVSDPTQSTPLTNQKDILRGMNVSYAIWKLAEVLWNTLTVNEQALARGQYNFFSTSLKNIQSGMYDKVFFKSARTVDIFPAFGGIGGAETDPTPSVTPPDDGNRSFWKEMIF